MNRNEFYKQLMSEYSFNDERIKSNAKKGRYAKQRNLPLFIGITAAAAVCTVAVGTTVALMNGGHGADLIEQDGLSALSANERLQKALEEIEKNADSKELHDVLISLAAPSSAEEVKALLTGYSESTLIKQLYFDDGTKAVGSEQVGAALSGSGRITGVVINCEGAMMKSLQSDSRIFSVEIVTASDLENVAPINKETAETIEVPAPDFGITVPDDTQQVLVVTVEPEDEPVTSETEEAGENIGDVEVGESEESGETEEIGTTEENTEETGDSTAEAPEQDTPEQPGQVIPEEPVIPDVTFPTKAEVFSYETDNFYADTAFFISDSCFFARTEDSIRLYSFDGSEAKLVASEACSKAKVVWVSENGGRLMVSGVDENGMRNKIFLVSAPNYDIIDIGAEDTVMDGTLASVGYNEDSRLLVMNIKENDVYYVCTMTVDGSGNASYLNTIFESTSRVSLLAANGNNVYLGVTHGGLTQIFRADAVNGGSTIIKTYDNSPTISKNLAFTHAVIAPGENAVIGFTEIFDPAAESFISADVFNDSVSFGASKHSFSVNGAYFTVSGGSIAQTDNVSVISKVEYRKGLSSLYCAAVSDGRVKITESVYSAKAKNEPLAYGELGDSCSSQLRAAADKAIGLSNAIALGRLKDSGINDLTSLKQYAGAYYSESAAAELLKACGASDVGYLKYDGSGLAALTIADTRLVITSQNDTSASGILYVKAGTIGGRTAFFAKQVSFVYENGAWKLNVVIR